MGASGEGVAMGEEGGGWWQSNAAWGGVACLCGKNLGFLNFRGLGHNSNSVKGQNSNKSNHSFANGTSPAVQADISKKTALSRKRLAQLSENLNLRSQKRERERDGGGLFSVHNSISTSEPNQILQQQWQIDCYMYPLLLLPES